MLPDTRYFGSWPTPFKNSWTITESTLQSSEENPLVEADEFGSLFRATLIPETHRLDLHCLKTVCSEQELKGADCQWTDKKLCQRNVGSFFFNRTNLAGKHDFAVPYRTAFKRTFFITQKGTFILTSLSPFVKDPV